MASNRSPPSFPVPQSHQSDVDEVANRIQGLRFGPPTSPPPGHPGGFIPLNILSQHDPYLSVNNPSQFASNKPLPPPPAPLHLNLESSPKPKARRSSPSERRHGPAMPVPSHYTASSSTPALPAAAEKSRRRRSDPACQITKPSAPFPSNSKPSSRHQSHSSDESDVQCSGITKEGRRCTRKVLKAIPDVSLYVDSAERVERYCAQHRTKILSPSGFYSQKPGLTVILFDTWIDGRLKDATKVALRAEMEKPVSTADEPGYIYCFEILNPNTPGHVHFKVGRSNNIHKRFDQWEKQCSSKVQIPRGRWPQSPDGSLLKGKMGAGEMGPYCHRLEKLIHLELADLAANSAYLDPQWHKYVPNALPSTSMSAPATPAKKSKKGRASDAKVSDARMSGRVCLDCGKTHKEIFTFAKMTGDYENREWDLIVRPVIEKWGMFVESCL